MPDIDEIHDDIEGLEVPFIAGIILTILSAGAMFVGLMYFLSTLIF